MSSGHPRPYVPAAVAPHVEAAQHLCRAACADGGSDFSIALLVKRGGSSPLVVFASGLNPQCDTATRKRLKAAAGMFFLSLPTAGVNKPPLPRNPITGLLWATAGPNATGSTTAVPQSASSFAPLPGAMSHTLRGGLPGGTPDHATGTVVPTAVTGVGGLVGGAPAGGGSVTTGGAGATAAEAVAGRNNRGVGAAAVAVGDVVGVGGPVADGGAGAGATDMTGNGRASAHGDNPAGGALSRGEIPVSLAATSRYGELPQLPAYIGTKHVTGKRSRGSTVTATPPLPEPRTWQVTQEMATSLKTRFSEGGISITRKHMDGFLTLLKHCYDVRLKRVGRNTPYEPLFPTAALGVTVNFQYIESGPAVLIPLVLKNVSSQHKNVTCSLILFMINDVGDEAYDWMLSRYCEGMRSHQSSPSAGVPRAKKAGGKNTAAELALNGAAAADRALVAVNRGVGGNGPGAARGGTSGGPGSVVPSSRRRALYFPSQPPPLPPVTNVVKLEGKDVGTCAVHLEFAEHHGTTLPAGHVSIILLSCHDDATSVRYPMDVHASFCVERGFPGEMHLPACLKQRLVWPIKQLGYVGGACLDAFVYFFLVTLFFLCKQPSHGDNINTT